MTPDSQNQSEDGVVEPDLSWFLIAVGRRKVGGYRDVVILDYSPGWAEHDIEFYWEDTFQSEPPKHLEPGAYRWTDFQIGFWGDDDQLAVTGGDFTRDSDENPEGGNEVPSQSDDSAGLKGIAQGDVP